MAQGGWPRVNRRLFWSGVVLSLLLKWIGASWDVSSHFRTTQDSANPAHFVNLAGNLLLAALLIAQWRGHRPEERRPLMAALVSMCIVGIAVPLDLGWHKVHGLDLTTWSPTHMLLFYGTAAACGSLAWLLTAHVGWRWSSASARPRLGAAAWALLVLLLARTLAPLLFPASFNEFAVVAAENLRTGQSIYSVDQTLIDFSAKFDDLPYADLPHALYPAYTLAIAGAFLVAVRRMSRTPGLATAAAAVYIAGRVVPDLFMAQVGFPVSAVPYHVLFVGVAVDVTWSLPVARWMRAAAGAGIATGLSYAFWAFPSDWPRRVPLDWAAVPWAFAAALLGCLLAATLPAAPFVRIGAWAERLPPARLLVWLANWRPRPQSPPS